MLKEKVCKFQFVISQMCLRTKSESCGEFSSKYIRIDLEAQGRNLIYKIHMLRILPGALHASGCMTFWAEEKPWHRDLRRIKWQQLLT